MPRDYTKESLQLQAAAKQANKRVCTDCGKPTTNYRCEKCWKKRRGFGAEDMEITSTEDKEAYLDGVAAAKGRRKRAPLTPSAPEVFTPMRPRPALPDRQGEFLANSDFRVITARSAAPKQERIIMAQTERTYTVAELAGLLGLSPKDVSNAKYSKTKNPLPGSQIGAVLEGMRLRGITWNQVVPAYAARVEKAPKTVPAMEAPAPPVPGPASALPLSARRENEPLQVSTVESVQPDPADGDVVDAGQPMEPKLDTLSRIEAELEAEAAQSGDTPRTLPSASNLLPPTYNPDFPLGHIPLESLVGEITRRMPRAEVVLR